MSLDAPIWRSFHFPSRSPGKERSHAFPPPTTPILPHRGAPQTAPPTALLQRILIAAPPPRRPRLASLLTLACGRLRVGLLVMQALAVHRDATVTVEFLSLGWRRLVHGPAVGSLLVLLAAVPPGAGGQTQSQG